MVQFQMELSHSVDSNYRTKEDPYDYSNQSQCSKQKKSGYTNRAGNSTTTNLTVSSWNAMLRSSNKRLDKHNNLSTLVNLQKRKSAPEKPQFGEVTFDNLGWEDREDEIYPSTGPISSKPCTIPMQKGNTEGLESDQKSYFTSYQESLMTTCSEIIDSLTSEKSSEELSKNIKIEKPTTTEEDDWISGFGSAISTDTTNETPVTIKQEVRSDEGAFNRSVRPSPSSYNPHLPLSLMPPTSSSSTGAHDASARSNSLSSVSGESANDTELSCTTPSPSASSNTLSIFNANQSQANHASNSTNSSSMAIRHTTPTSGSPSSNPSSILASPSAPTTTAQHSFTLTPLGPQISSGYGGGISGPGGSTYFPPGCANTSSRFTNPSQQPHSYDGSFHNSWTAPFGGAGIGRTQYNAIPQFMTGQNQAFSGSQFQNNVVSNLEGSSSFFTHGSGGGGLIAPPSNGNQNTDRSSRGGDSNGSSPHGVNSGSDSPHLSHGIFGHGVDEGHGGAGGNQVGVMGGTTRKREIRLIKNREAARECRRKKKEYIKCLENRVAVLENQNKALIEELKSLKSLYNSSSTTKMNPSNEGMKSNKM